MTSADLPPHALTFVKRAAAHVEAGMSYEAAMRQVLEDDLRLFLALHKPMTNADGSKGDTLAGCLARETYNRIRNQKEQST